MSRTSIREKLLIRVRTEFAKQFTRKVIDDVKANQFFDNADQQLNELAIGEIKKNEQLEDINKTLEEANEEAKKIVQETGEVKEFFGNSNSKYLIIIGIIIAVVLAGVLLFIVFRKGKEPEINVPVPNRLLTNRVDNGILTWRNELAAKKSDSSEKNSNDWRFEKNLGFSIF